MTAVECTLYAEHLWISPYVFSSFVALREKGVHFDVVELALSEREQASASTFGPTTETLR